MISTSHHHQRAGMMPSQPEAPRRPVSPARVALAEWWRAMTRAVHAAWCLPELGGCPEEPIEMREPAPSGPR